MIKHANTYPPVRLALPRKRSGGFTLIELMVAIAIGLFVIAVVIQGFVATSGTTNTNSLVAESSTNGRHALEAIKREVRHAALHRLVWDSTQFVTDDAALSAKDFGCGAGFVTALEKGIEGFNDNNPYAATCLRKANDREYLRGDVLVLRRTNLEPSATFDSGAPYVRTAYGAASLFTGSAGAEGPLLLQPRFDYRLVSDIYFVNAFTNSSTESPRVPALYRLTLAAGSNPLMVPELVASNVEHFQVQYAVTDTAGNTRYYNANAVADWNAVTTARVWVLTRDSSPDPGLVSGKYTIGDVVYEPKDNFRRSVYTTTIAIRNH